MTLRDESDSPVPVPHSPIAGVDDGFGVPSEMGGEVRRARFVAEIVYPCGPGEFVDIEAHVRDAISDGLGNGLGSYILALDLTEHVRLKEAADVA